MSKQYVEKRDGGYWIKGKRISLDSVVYSFQSGQSPESINRSFRLLTLEEIYGAITFYLANQNEINDYLIQENKEIEKMREKSRENDSDWHEKMENYRKETLKPQIST